MTQEKLLELLHDMSLEEKVGQMYQLMAVFYDEDVQGVLTGPAGQLGIGQEEIALAGSILGTAGAEQLTDFQKRYMERQPHHIPMLFMMDVIHGMRTIFPAPLGLGATFDPALVGQCAETAAREAAACGLHATFTPMADLVRDARWGRVMESTGEDPYLNSLMSEAVVKGLQGDDMGAPGRICACVKHFAAYGAPTAGRDYNTVELSEHTLREFYLPAYRAGIDAGAGLVMTSFNTINGIPATTNKWLMRKVLREEMGFEGVLISDYAAVAETIAHGYSEDEKDAAKKAVEAGVDIDMMTGCYAGNLAELVREGAVDEALIDEAVLRILELKNRLGLFENPYKDADPEAEKALCLCEEHRKLARKTAAESFVLLKNDGILPLNLSKKIAFIGPYTDNKNMLSTWAITGDSADSVSIAEAAREVFDPTRTSYHAGSQLLGNDVRLTGFEGANGYQSEDEYRSREELDRMLGEAKLAAAEADLVVMPLGEHFLQTGEATSRGTLGIPDVQLQLFREICAVNPNIVVVLFNGRPLDLREISEKARAVLEVWLPGTEGGHAIVDVLTGKVNPSGKLPMSFPYSIGQVPVHYNEYATGRPNRPEVEGRFFSKYIDIPNEPLYPFGFGLSYTTFEISKIRLGSSAAEDGEAVAVKTGEANAAKANETDAAKADETNAAKAEGAGAAKAGETDAAKTGEANAVKAEGAAKVSETDAAKAGEVITIKEREPIRASVTVRNTGGCSGALAVQLYLRDLKASVVRPVRELKGIRRVTLAPGECTEVSFDISEEMLRFLRADGTYGSEPGVFHVWIGDSSTTQNRAEFRLV